MTRDPAPPVDSPKARSGRWWAVALTVSAALILGVAALTIHLSSNDASQATLSGPLLPASPTALPTFDPARFQALLVQLRGKPVVINVWGSWCAPCIAEAPRLAEAANLYRGRVQFVGVDILDQPAPARSFIRRYDWSYPSVFDPRAAIRDGMGLLGQPVTILLDASGSRVHLWSGAVPLDQLRQEIDRTLGS